MTVLSRAATVTGLVAVLATGPLTGSVATADSGPLPLTTIGTSTLTGGDSPFDSFGYAVDVDGDTAVIGAPGIQARGGAAYVYVRSGAGWRKQATLQAPDGAVNDTFGFSVTVDGDTAVVGSVYDAPGGSAYVFRRTGAVWALEAKLRPPDPARSGQFAAALDLEGDLLAVGADRDDTATGVDSGAAHLFVRRGSVWRLQQTVVASDSSTDDNFGTSVDLSGTTLSVGAPGADDLRGAAYVFDRTGGGWTEVARILAPDPGGQFGRSIAVDRATLLVGAPENRLGQGSAYLFDRAGPGFLFQAELVAPDAQMFDEFGSSVVLAGPVAVVGAAFDDVAGQEVAGSAYVFRQEGGDWRPRGHLTEPSSPGFFGRDMALEGDTLFVGAAGFGRGPGVTYLYTVLPG